MKPSRCSALLRQLARFPVTAGYAGALVAVSFWQRSLADEAEARLVAETSTNMRNLADGRIQTLWESAFVTLEGPGRLWTWLPGFACLLALGELFLRPRRLAGVLLLGHVGGTAVVAAGLAVALRFGWVADSVADEADVGVSYAAMGVLGALAGAAPRAVRPVWALGWLAVAAEAFWSGRDFTSAGHLASLGLGVVAGLWLSRGWLARWTLVRLCLAAGAFAFGLGVLGSV